MDFCQSKENKFSFAPIEQLDISEFTAYPDPGMVQVKIKFKLDSKGLTEVQIRDMKGGAGFYDKFKNKKEGSFLKDVNLVIGSGFSDAVIVYAHAYRGIIFIGL